MLGRAMILGSVPRGSQSRGPCEPLGRRPLGAVDPWHGHPAGAVKRKVQAGPPAWTIIANARTTRALDRLIADVAVGGEMNSLPSKCLRRSICRRARRSFN